SGIMFHAALPFLMLVAVPYRPRSIISSKRSTPASLQRWGSSRIPHLTHSRCGHSLHCANETRLKQIELCTSLHLSFDEFKLGDLAFGLAVRPCRCDRIEFQVGE